MSLQRTPLRRVKPLTRRSRLWSKGQLRAARQVSTQASRRAAAAGPSLAQKQLVAERAGWCCELCGMPLHNGRAWHETHSFHHRLPRGMGGTSAAASRHDPHQLLLVCGTGTTGCHGLIESQRQLAYGNGWLVRHGQDPANVPALVYSRVRPVYLTPAGGYQEATQ